MRVKRFQVKKISGEEFVYVSAKIFNPDKPKSSKKLEFLVDTGATGCTLPKSVAGELGLQEKGVVDVGLADGRSVKASAAYILLEVGNRKIYTWAIIGEGFEPIIGVDVMKVLRIHVDVSEKNPLIPLKHLKINAITMNNNFHTPFKTRLEDKRGRLTQPIHDGERGGVGSYNAL